MQYTSVELTPDENICLKFDFLMKVILFYVLKYQNALN